MSNRSGNEAWPALRRAWIERRAMARGTIRRREICERLGVSMAQASADLQQLLIEHPECLKYSLREKAYCWEGKRLRTRVPEFVVDLVE